MVKRTNITNNIMSKIVKKDLDVYNTYSSSDKKQMYYEKINELTIYSTYSSAFYSIKEILENLDESVVFRPEMYNAGYDDNIQIVFYRVVEESDELYQKRMEYHDQEKKRRKRLAEKAASRKEKAQERKYQKYLELKKEFG
jgi:hypothetical protein